VLRGHALLGAAQRGFEQVAAGRHRLAAAAVDEQAEAERQLLAAVAPWRAFRGKQ
jgi:hypothetical protein